MRHAPPASACPGEAQNAGLGGEGAPAAPAQRDCPSRTRDHGHVKRSRDGLKAWAGTGFKNAAVEHGTTIGIDVEIIPRNSQARGSHVLKRRWVVERGLGRLMLHRRLARDYETLDSSSEAMIHIASIDNLTRLITGETTPTWRGTY
jgi:transposase